MTRGPMVERAPALSLADDAFVRSLVIHEDEALLAFDKPSGLPVQTRNPDDRTLDMLLRAFAKSNGKRPRLVHRLDAQTSGVIIAARTQPAAAALSEAFAHRQVKKAYLALVSGEAPAKKTGLVEAVLARYRLRPELELMRAARPGDDKPQEASTHWEVLASTGRRHLLLLKPRTGRMHQIRAHLSILGLPIFGDVHYGGDMSLGGAEAVRLMLHAWRLSGPHPSGEVFNLSAPPPEDFRALAGQAGAEIAEALANLPASA